MDRLSHLLGENLKIRFKPSESEGDRGPSQQEVIDRACAGLEAARDRGGKRMTALQSLLVAYLEEIERSIRFEQGARDHAQRVSDRLTELERR